MGKKSIAFKGAIGGSSPSLLTTTAPISHLETKIRFSFRNCDIGNFCIRKLGDNEIEKFYKRLAHFEGLNWQQIKQMPRENGFSEEQKESSNYQSLASIFTDFTNFFHFRVNGTQHPFRVFATQKEDLCYLLWIDKEGVVNH